MPTTKHEIFKIRVSSDDKFSLSGSTKKTINKFLSQSNVVYVNHSISTLIEEVENKYGDSKTVTRYVILSLIYKDLNETPLDVSEASDKIKDVIHKQIETDSKIGEPETKTSFDKEIEKLNSTS